MKIFWVFLAWSLWFTISWAFPFGGLIGDVIFRLSIGNSLSDDLRTFAFSWIPVLGPIISSYVLLQKLQCKHN